ncbi:efflux RND transporter permease subunit [Methylophaga sp.]|uniref:efflux RND transporter permease subunit n=1 Tax=Methylophaga sp. TaxID=2024840 RepID=UPI003A94BB2A
MLSKVVAFSVRFRGVVVALASMLLIYGVYKLSNSSLDIFPEFAPKQVIIQTEAQGLTAEQVEVLVTQPLENALGGLVGMESIRSQSIPSLSVLTLTFYDNTDIYLDRQLVSERLLGLKEVLPAGVGAPLMVPLESSSGTIMTIGLTSDSQDLMTLRSLVDWTLAPRLLSVDGVADINVFGGHERQLQIQIKPDKLAKYGISIDEVTTVAQQATGIMGTGFVENQNQRMTIQVSGQPLNATQLAKVVVRKEGNTVLRLGDIASVKEAPAPTIGGAAIGGKPAVVLMVIGQYKANTLAVTEGIEAALDEFKDGFGVEGITLHDDLFRPANYIQTSLVNIQEHLMVGGGLVMLVLILFLFNIRTAVISMTAIPLSLFAAMIVLLEFGININIMVLGGLAIALGEVVDDAIIDTENIFRRLRQNALLAAPKPTMEVVYEASMEVRSSVVYASFIVMLVFVPLLTLSGVAGRMFEPLGEAYILAIFASLAVALTVTPALCHILLTRAGDVSHDEPPLIRMIKPIYGRVLSAISHFPRLTLLGVLGFCVAGLSILPFLGGSFLPELREGHYIIHTASVPGTSIEESLRIGGRIEQRVAEIPGVRSTSQWAGRAERGADTFGTHYSEYEVDLEPMDGPSQQRVLDEIREILEAFPGVNSEVNTFLTERIDETISGYTSPIVVNIYGKNLDALDQTAQEVAEVMRDIDGAADVQLRAPPGEPQLEVRLDLDKLAYWGLRPAEVMQAVRTGFDGAVVGQVYEGNQVFDVVVVLPEELRKQPQQLRVLPIQTPEGVMLRLQDIAVIQQVSGRHMIQHRGSQRLQTVTANVTDRDLSSFFAELKERVHDEVAFTADIYPEFTGAAVAQAQSREDLIVHSTLAGLAVLLLLYVALQSFRNMILVLINLPFSLVGGVLAVVLTNGVLSIGSLVGFVTLFGITLRNAIMLVSHYQYMVKEEGAAWNLDTAIRGAQERLPSILITALVTALAMLPIAINSDSPGREIMGPMASIIIGGLISSTVLNLLVLPSVMLRYGRFKTSREAQL